MIRKSRNFWTIWLHSSQNTLKTLILSSMAAMLTPMITEQVMTASILLLELRAAIILSGTALTRVTRMLLVSAWSRWRPGRPPQTPGTGPCQ